MPSSTAASVLSLFLLSAFFTERRIMSSTSPGITGWLVDSRALMTSFNALTPSMLSIAPGMPCPVQSAATIIL